MANTPNIMSIAPKQAAASTRRISPNTQPKYKSAARAGNKTFGSALDQVNAKLDELKQNIQDLKDANKKLAQVEGESKSLDATTETPAQGQSNTPQDAEQAIGNDSAVADKDAKPADIFFVRTQPVDAPKIEPPKISGEGKIPVENFVQPTLPAAVPASLDSAADAVDEQPATNFIAVDNSAYLFAPKPIAQVEAPKVDGAQNLMTLMPQAQDNAQSMLNLLGGRAWRPVDVQAQPLDIQPTIQPQAQPVDVQPMIQAQAQPVDVQPQVQAQAQPLDVQPMIQPQAQPVDVQPTIQPQAQPVDVQPTIQAQAQLVDVQPTIQPQAQPVDVQPMIQTQAQPVDVQPTIQAQAQPVDVQPTIQAQAQPLDVQPQVQAQAQPLDVQPMIQPQAQPVDVQSQVQAQAQPVDVQPTIQAQAQPVDVQPMIQPQAQPVDVQPTIQAQAQPVDVQPPVQAQAQPLDVQPMIQPQAQPVDVQPTIQAQAQPVDVQPPVQPQAQPVNIHPTQIQQPTQAQPLIAPQLADERPAVQIFSEMLGVNVQVEDAPTAAPVTPPQQFNQNPQQQPQQQDAQNFQNQIFQAAADAPQAQQPSTGGEVFTLPLTPAADAPQSQPTTPAQAPDAPQPQPQEDFDVPAQIVRQARLIRTAENTEMVIKLNPEHLGELTLRVSVSANGAVNASFHSDNAQVRTIIENSLVMLKQELSNIGLKVENVDVYAGLSDGGLLGGQGGQAWQQGRQQRQGNRQVDLNTIERDLDATAPVNESTTDGVDYSV